MGIKIDFVKETDKEYEEIKKLIPSASKYAFMKVDHLIVVPLFQVMDIINKYEEQEPTTKNNLGVDCISREQAIEEADKLCLETGYDNEKVIEMLNELPSVTPIRPKGHWTEEFNDLEGEVRFTCSSCGKYQLFGTDFCYNCGSDNREVEE